jgi:hypothetical protein
MKVAGSVNRAHTTNTYDLLNGIAINKNIPPLELLDGLSCFVEVLGSLMVVQLFLPYKSGF